MADLPPNLTVQQIQQFIQDALDQRESDNAYGVSLIPYHTHNKIDSPPVDPSNLTAILPTQTGNSGSFLTTINNIISWAKAVLVGLATIGVYASKEYDNGNVTTTATINWLNGNVQYVTLTGNTTFTFTNPLSGMRCVLQVAGGFTPTFPGTVRWPNSVTPTATATAGVKDIYTFIYSVNNTLYDGVQSAKFSTT